MFYFETLKGLKNNKGENWPMITIEAVVGAGKNNISKDTRTGIESSFI